MEESREEEGSGQEDTLKGEGKFSPRLPLPPPPPPPLSTTTTLSTSAASSSLTLQPQSTAIQGSYI